MDQSESRSITSTAGFFLLGVGFLATAFALGGDLTAFGLGGDFALGGGRRAICFLGGEFVNVSGILRFPAAALTRIVFAI